MNLNVEYLEEARKDALLSITELADVVEISETTYRKILNGGEVTGRIIRKLIKRLKLDKERLIRTTE